MDRKKFLVSACALCAMGLTATMIDSCSTTAPFNFTLNLHDTGNVALGSVGGSVTVTTNSGTPAIVIKTSSGYKAMSLVCTHNGCTVNYAGSRGFTCPCHGATFDANGAVTGGPAPTSLPQYTVTQASNILTIKG